MTSGGNCLRMMYAGADQHTVRHTWELDSMRGLKLFTERKDSKRPGGWTKPSVAYCPAFEEALSKRAKEKACEVMHGKRETARKKGTPQRSAGGADSLISCPIVAAIAASRPRTTIRTTDGRKGPSADPEVRYIFSISCVCVYTPTHRSSVDYIVPAAAGAV